MYALYHNDTHSATTEVDEYRLLLNYPFSAQK